MNRRVVRQARPARAWLALALLAAAALAMIGLGRWQLGRAEQKRAALAAVQAGHALPALALAPAVPAADLVPFRPVVATGQWLADRTVLLDNRMAGGRPGFWVVTPLVLDGEPARAVAVLRGWLPRPFPDGPVSVRTPSGTVSIRGQLVSQAPRLFDLSRLGGRAEALPARLPDPSSALPRVQNLDLDPYARAAGQAMLPVLVEQTGDAGDGLLRQWPGPPTNIDMHRGYALQWFSFAAIAAVAFGVILVRHFRFTR